MFSGVLSCLALKHEAEHRYVTQKLHETNSRFQIIYLLCFWADCLSARGPLMFSADGDVSSELQLSGLQRSMIVNIFIIRINVQKTNLSFNKSKVSVCCQVLSRCCCVCLSVLLLLLSLCLIEVAQIVVYVECCAEQRELHVCLVFLFRQELSSATRALLAPSE